MKRRKIIEETTTTRVVRAKYVCGYPDCAATFVDKQLVKLKDKEPLRFIWYCSDHLGEPVYAYNIWGVPKGEKAFLINAEFPSTWPDPEGWMTKYNKRSIINTHSDLSEAMWCK